MENSMNNKAICAVLCDKNNIQADSILAVPVAYFEQKRTK